MVEIAQGEKSFSMKFGYDEDENDDPSNRRWKHKTITINMYWDEIITTLAPKIQLLTPESMVRQFVSELIYRRRPRWQHRAGIENIEIIEDFFQEMKSQLRYWKLIGIVKTGVPIFQIFWHLTDKGDLYLVHANAMRA